MLKVSAVYLDNQKSFIPKKYMSEQVSKSNKIDELCQGRNVKVEKFGLYPCQAKLGKTKKESIEGHFEMEFVCRTSQVYFSNSKK